MGITHLFFRLSNEKIEELMTTITDALIIGKVDQLREYLAQENMLLQVEKRIGEIRVETRSRGFFRARTFQGINPKGGVILEQVLQIFSEGLPQEMYCDADRAFYLLMTGGYYSVDFRGINHFGIWQSALDGGIEVIPERFLSDESPGFGFIAANHCEILSNTTQEVMQRCVENEDYLCDALADFQRLLKSCKDDESIVVLQP